MLTIQVSGFLAVLLISTPALASQDIQQCSNYFCVRGDYDKLELPTPYNRTSVEVTVTPHILEIFEISDTESSITLSMYLGVKWEDSRIINSHTILEDLQGVDFQFLSHLWQPDIEIHHIRRVSEPKVMGKFLAGLQINRGERREVLLSQVVIATVTCPMRFLYYPFDSHTCPILFGSYTWDYNYLTFHIDNTFLTKVYEQNTNLDYDIAFRNASHSDYHNYNDEDRSLYLYDNGELGNLSLTGFNVDIRRQHHKHLVVYYIPSGLFVLVSWTSFIIPPDVVAGRMGLLITVLLCLVNIFNVVNNHSPSVRVNYHNVLSIDSQILSKGVTGLSLWVLACIMFVFSAVMAYTAILSKTLINDIKLRFRRQFVIPELLKEVLSPGEAPIIPIQSGNLEFYKGIDALLIFLFPLGFLIFNCIYWYYYMGVHTTKLSNYNG